MANNPALPTLYFDPDKHPDSTLKAFNEFIETFELRYDALYPEPPKISLETAIQRWKLCQGDEKAKQMTGDEFDDIKNGIRSTDRVTKLLGMFSSKRLYQDWVSAEPSEKNRKGAQWDTFLTKMRALYKPTENPTLKNYHFRQLAQREDETLTAFCNRVENEAKHCQFNCDSEVCTAESTAIRDQVVIGTVNNTVREEALLKSWDLKTLRKEGMQVESAQKSGAELAGDHVRLVGKYSAKQNKKQHGKQKRVQCFFCGESITSINQHRENHCKGIHNKCSNCQKVGHLPQVCKSTSVNKMDKAQDEPPTDDDANSTYSINIFRIKTTKRVLPEYISKKKDYSTHVMVNNRLAKLIADTGAKVSVCGTAQARQWGILSRMVPSKTRLKPYGSAPIPVHGEARCAVTFGSTSVPVNWHIVSGSCEPILAGSACEELGIIQFNESPAPFQPIRMIESDVPSESKQLLQDTLKNYPENFTGLGKLRHYQVKLHIDESVKPVAVPPRSVPYHLQERFQKAIDEMVQQDVIEEHPVNEPAPWVSCAVITSKPDGGMRVTMDAKNVNKAIHSMNHPIPRQEDIKAKLAGATVFSKLDFNKAFWQLELHPDSRHIAVFHANDKLYQYKRLIMGLKPAQGELNIALKPIFAHLKDAHLIHDDLVLATKTHEEHNELINEVMKAVSRSGLTLNPEKCFFGLSEIRFWGMVFGKDGVKPDPEKVETLKHITRPENKEELVSFLCMMQSNAEFIENFAHKSACLRQMTRSSVRFQWRQEQEECFQSLIRCFKDDTLLRYFCMKKHTYIMADAHVSGLGVALAQGDSIESARPVAFASRTTSEAERNYPQLDLEAMALDYGLRRFRNYIVGSPHTIILVTDHKPLESVFNGSRKGSIRTERIKMRHQDIRYKVIYRKGKANSCDYLSRHATPWKHVPDQEQTEAADLNNLLYTLHTTPIIDRITLAGIAQATSSDNVLAELRNMVKRGHRHIPKSAREELKRFTKILPEITVTGNGILLKGERIILPQSLQEESIKLAHQGSHTGQTGIVRRLRYHFFFHGMEGMVQDFVRQCESCQLFTDKKTQEPIIPHKVPEKCWSEVAVDLFGPMPNAKHVVVVQDMASRFPAAKIIASTKADKVIPAIEDIYDAYGNPDSQLSDNGPPFNSKAMEHFASKRDICLKKTPPLHPSSNPVETFMKPLGKAMKTAHNGNKSKHTVLTQLLSNYRDTPHPATGLPPAAMLFRDAPDSAFPRVTVSEYQVAEARKRDCDTKVERQLEVNNSKYKKRSDVKIGDWVLIRNFTKRSKFDPLFQPEPCMVTEILDGWVVVERAGTRYTRHRDDIKTVPNFQPISPPPSNMEARQQIQWEFPSNGDDDDYAAYYIPPQQEASTAQQYENTTQTIPRRSARLQQHQEGSPASDGPLGQQEESSAQILGQQEETSAQAPYQQTQHPEEPSVRVATGPEGTLQGNALQDGTLQGSQQQAHQHGATVENAGTAPALIAPQQVLPRRGLSKALRTQQLLRNLHGDGGR